MTDKSYTIWRAILISGMVIGLAGIVGEMVWNADKGELNGVEVTIMATSAKITIAGAVETALGSITGQAIEAGLEKKGDKTVWNVEILTTEEAIMAVYVDADSGEVMMTENKVVGKGWFRTNYCSHSAAIVAERCGHEMFRMDRL